jgi:hypothetical protein
VAWLPELVFEGAAELVVQVIEERTGDVLYTVRVPGNRFQPRVYAPGKYTIAVGRDLPNGTRLTGVEAGEKRAVGQRAVVV